MYTWPLYTSVRMCTCAQLTRIPIRTKSTNAWPISFPWKYLEYRDIRFQFANNFRVLSIHLSIETRYTKWCERTKNGSRFSQCIWESGFGYNISVNVLLLLLLLFHNTKNESGKIQRGKEKKEKKEKLYSFRLLILSVNVRLVYERYKDIEVTARCKHDSTVPWNRLS